MKPEAISSQASEVTHLAEFPWRSLPSMLSEFVHYRHLIFSARAITFVTVTQLGFMLHTFMHSKSIFLGVCAITWVIFLLSVVLRQSLLYGSCVSLLEHLYSHSSNGKPRSFYFFWWTFMIFKHMCLLIYLLSIFVFTLGTLKLVLSLNLNLHVVLTQYQQVTKVHRYWQVSQT